MSHSERYFLNPYQDFNINDKFNIDEKSIKKLIIKYVNIILENTTPDINEDRRGDLYVGDAGIAFMFLRLNDSQHFKNELNSLEYAKKYIDNAKKNAKQYSKRSDELCSFLCGNAGIYAVSTVISSRLNDSNEFENDLKNFKTGFDACKPINFNKYGSDEILVGRAGYLSGIFWLNQSLETSIFNETEVNDLCESIVKSGRQYSKLNKSPLPLMYQYHGSEYLGAAHGVCSIFHMLLQSSWFKKLPGSSEFQNISSTKLYDIKTSIEKFLELQDDMGNFPVTLESIKPHRKEKRLVHWCHGSPGAVYLLAKSFLIFGEEKYLIACKKAADLVWHQGLLYKGPGICHGIGGNAYVFIILYRLTLDLKYLYRASKFMEFLNNDEFLQKSNTPDRPYSLYEGLAGTVCFLIDLLDPTKGSFPFMDVFK